MLSVIAVNGIMPRDAMMLSAVTFSVVVLNFIMLGVLVLIFIM